MKAVFSRWLRGKHISSTNAQLLGSAKMKSEMFFSLCILITPISTHFHMRAFCFGYHLAQLRDAFSFITAPNGQLSWYKTCVRVKTNVNRAKDFVVGCHLKAQLQQIPTWLTTKQGLPSHVVLNRVIDDTNVWTMPEPGGGQSDDDDDDDNADNATTEGEFKVSRKIKSKAKVAPAMGFIQRLCARFSGETVPQCVRIHVPFQLLPKAL